MGEKPKQEKIWCGKFSEFKKTKAFLLGNNFQQNNLKGIRVDKVWIKSLDIENMREKNTPKIKMLWKEIKLLLGEMPKGKRSIFKIGLMGNTLKGRKL